MLGEVSSPAYLCLHMRAVEFAASTAICRLIQAAPSAEWVQALNDRASLLPALQIVYDYASGTREQEWAQLSPLCESCMWDTSRPWQLTSGNANDAVANALGVSGYDCMAAVAATTKLVGNPGAHNNQVGTLLLFLFQFTSCSGCPDRLSCCVCVYDSHACWMQSHSSCACPTAVPSSLSTMRLVNLWVCHDPSITCMSCLGRPRNALPLKHWPPFVNMNCTASLCWRVTCCHACLRH